MSARKNMQTWIKMRNQHHPWTSSRNSNSGTNGNVCKIVIQIINRSTFIYYYTRNILKNTGQNNEYHGK